MTYKIIASILVDPFSISDHICQTILSQLDIERPFETNTEHSISGGSLPEISIEILKRTRPFDSHFTHTLKMAEYRDQPDETGKRKYRSDDNKYCLGTVQFIVDSQSGQIISAHIANIYSGQNIKGHEVVSTLCKLLDAFKCPKITLTDRSFIKVNPEDENEEYSYQLLNCIKDGNSWYEKQGFELTEGWISHEKLQSTVIYQWAIKELQNTSLQWILDTHSGTLLGDDANYSVQQDIHAHIPEENLKELTLHTYVNYLYKNKINQKMNKRDFDTCMFHLENLLLPNENECVEDCLKENQEITSQILFFRLALDTLNQNRNVHRHHPRQARLAEQPLLITPRQLEHGLTHIQTNPEVTTLTGYISFAKNIAA